MDDVGTIFNWFLNNILQILISFSLKCLIICRQAKVSCDPNFNCKYNVNLSLAYDPYDVYHNPLPPDSPPHLPPSYIQLLSWDPICQYSDPQTDSKLWYGPTAVPSHVKITIKKNEEALHLHAVGKCTPNCTLNDIPPFRFSFIII